jgi:hypothetical protein
MNISLLSSSPNELVPFRLFYPGSPGHHKDTFSSSLYLSAILSKTVETWERKIACWYDRKVDFGFLFGARRKRLIGASVHFARHTLPVAIRPARILWNQMIGFLFLVLAFAFAVPGYTALRNFKGDGSSWLRVICCGILTAVMLVYGISSFLKARKIARL